MPDLLFFSFNYIFLPFFYNPSIHSVIQFMFWSLIDLTIIGDRNLYIFYCIFLFVLYLTMSMGINAWMYRRNQHCITRPLLNVLMPLKYHGSSLWSCIVNTWSSLIHLQSRSSILKASSRLTCHHTCPPYLAQYQAYVYLSFHLCCFPPVSHTYMYTSPVCSLCQPVSLICTSYMFYFYLFSYL